MEENNIAINRNKSQDCDKSICNDLNLCKLLADQIGTEFYSPFYGKSTICFVSDEEIVIEANGKKHNLTQKGTYPKNPLGMCNLFPSSELYAQFPFDPCSAWYIWEEKRRLIPTWWRAKKNMEYWSINPDGSVFMTTEDFSVIDNDLYNYGKYFRTAEDARRASDLIRETLQKFHENQEKK